MPIKSNRGSSQAAQQSYAQRTYILDYTRSISAVRIRLMDGR